MIFLMGSIFVFGSWVCKTDDEGNLQGWLIEAQEAYKEFTLLTGSAEDLAKRFSCLIVFELSWAPMTTRPDLVFGSDSSSESDPGFFRDKSSTFQLDSRTRHQLFKRSIRTNFKVLLGSWVASQLDSTMWRVLIKTYSEEQSVQYGGYVLPEHRKALY
jgi:hypothetical protein